MVRLYITAEGLTEQNFARQLLEPHLAERGVYLSGIRLTALCRKKGKVHRGGMSRYLPVKNDICRWLKVDRNPDARFTTMIDLYGLPNDFPGYAEARGMPDPHRRVEALEAALQEDIGDLRFTAYIQLHEFEALLFSDPKAFGCYYDLSTRQIEALTQVCQEFTNPELIDDGEQTAPSKRIGKGIRDYLGAKPTAGPIIAAEIGLGGIRAKCPHFHDWLTKLEKLGTGTATD